MSDTNTKKPAPKALILIADGTEEMEFTITYDTLVRGGFECTSAYVTGRSFNNYIAPPQTQINKATFYGIGGSTSNPVRVVENAPVATCSRGVRIMADVSFGEGGEEFGPDKYDLMVIPGGLTGAESMSQDPHLHGLVNEYVNANKWVGMICAGSILASRANLKRQPITSHPAVISVLDTTFDYSEESIVVSDRLVTTRGPGSTFQFALTLVGLIQGEDKRMEITPPMMFPRGTPLLY